MNLYQNTDLNFWFRRRNVNSEFRNCYDFLSGLKLIYYSSSFYFFYEAIDKRVPIHMNELIALQDISNLSIFFNFPTN